MAPRYWLILSVFLHACVGLSWGQTNSSGCGAWEGGLWMTSLQGTLQSPYYPGSYANDSDCFAYLTLPPAYRINLTFTDFNLEEAGGFFYSSCLYDYLEIRDGNSSSSPLLGTYCGSSLPTSLRSFTNTLWFRFHTDVSVTRPGFSISYTSDQDYTFFLITSNEAQGIHGAIFRVDMETVSNYPIPFSSHARPYSPVAVDFDPVEERVYWAELGPKCNCTRSSTLYGNDVRTIFNTSSAQIRGLAVDPLSRLLFFTNSDSGGQTISAMTLTTRVHWTVVRGNLSNPHAIVLDTHNGVMFWTSRGLKAKIEQANYDGSERRTLVDSLVYYINALALDTRNNRLYWVDGGTDRVEMLDLTNKNRTLLLSLAPQYHFYGLAFFQDQLFITDHNRYRYGSSVIRMPTASPNNATIWASHGDTLNDLHVYDNSPKDTGLNGCGLNNGGCSVICIPLPGNKSKCACPDGEATSLANPKTCVDATGNFTVNVKAGHPMPFKTDGRQYLTLTCEHDSGTDVSSYVWSVTCLTSGQRSCMFQPRPESDGLLVTCVVTLQDGRSGRGDIQLNINYPPREAPSIHVHGATRNTPVPDGSPITLSCTVFGGKPRVTSVTFDCPGIRGDNPHDLIDTNKVTSFLTLTSMTLTMNGTTCRCRGLWEQARDWYTLTSTYVLRVKESPSTTSRTPDVTTPYQKTSQLKGEHDQKAGTVVGVVIGLLLVIVAVIVVVVFIIVRKRKNAAMAEPKPGRQGVGAVNFQNTGPFTILGRPRSNDRQPFASQDENTLNAEKQEAEPEFSTLSFQNETYGKTDCNRNTDPETIPENGSSA